jgi:HK97 family phage major capsid protein
MEDFQMSNTWFTKDADGVPERDKMIKDSQNPEVVKLVLAEIDRNDGKHKKNYEELNREFNELKHLVEQSAKNLDPLITEQVGKISEAITTRQTEIDNDYAAMKEQEKAQREEYESKLIRRVDSLEIAFKRPRGVPGDMSEADEAKLARQFQIDCMALPKDGKGAHWSVVKNIQPDIEVYKGYVEQFETFMRQKDSERTMSATELKQLSVGADPEGGYTVTPAMGSRIITRIYEMDPIRQMASVETISTGAIEWMVDWGQAGFGWEGETETGAETSTADFKKKRIPNQYRKLARRSRWS